MSVLVKMASEGPRALKLGLALKAGLTAEGGTQKPAETERGDAGEEEGHGRIAGSRPANSRSRMTCSPASDSR